MRRRVFKLVPFLLLGAIVNIAVAWGLGWLVRFDIASTSSTQQPLAGGPDTGDPVSGERMGPAGLWLMRYKRAGAEHVIVQVTDGTMVDWSIIGETKPRPPIAELWPRWGPLARHTPREFFDDQPQQPRAYAARGWPALCLWCEFERGHGMPLGGIGLGQVATPGTFISTDRVLPLRPIWPGFAINTIFYAAVLWLVFAAPGFVRRRIRRFRGRCIHCGYDLRGQPSDSHKCPECGRCACVRGAVRDG